MKFFNTNSPVHLVFSSLFSSITKMSFQNKNLYALLGNDVSAPEEHLAPKEIVAPQKSTKKDGVPPKADASKAKKQQKKPVDGAKFVNKNKQADAPANTARKSSKDKKHDRKSRTGRSETAKSERQKAGSEAESQLAGEADAEEELAEESAAAEPKVKLTSAADYFKQQQPAAAKTEEKEVELDDSKVISKTVEVFFAKTSAKKTKAPKQQKQKKFLDSIL